MRSRTFSHPGNVSLAGAASTTFAMGMAPSARIKKIRVRQASGTPQNFTADVYTSKYAVPGATPPTGWFASPESCRFGTQITGTSGNNGDFADSNGQVFRNLDSTPANPAYLIYVVITPSTPVAQTKWDVTIDAELDGIGGDS